MSAKNGCRICGATPFVFRQSHGWLLECPECRVTSGSHEVLQDALDAWDAANCKDSGQGSEEIAAWRMVALDIVSACGSSAEPTPANVRRIVVALKNANDSLRNHRLDVARELGLVTTEAARMSTPSASEIDDVTLAVKRMKTMVAKNLLRGAALKEDDEAILAMKKKLADAEEVIEFLRTENDDLGDEIKRLMDIAVVACRTPHPACRCEGCSKLNEIYELD